MHDTVLYKLLDLHLDSKCSIQFIFSFYTFNSDVSGFGNTFINSFDILWLSQLIKVLKQFFSKNFINNLINQRVFFSSNCSTFYGVHAITGHFLFSFFQSPAPHNPPSHSTAGSVDVPTVTLQPSIAILLWLYQHISQIPFYCADISPSNCVLFNPFKR